MKTQSSTLVVVTLMFALTSTTAFSQNTYKATLNFPNDVYTLSQKQRTYLDDFFKSLRNIPAAYRFTITGHTDSIGSSNYNNSLSYKRAAATAAYLVSKGYKQRKMQLQGKGFAIPASNH